MTALSAITGYGGMLLILLGGMLVRDRRAKYKFRMAGYVYMICLESSFGFFSEGRGFRLYHVVIVLFWFWLAYKDFLSSRYFDREFARLDVLKEQSKAAIAKLFYDRRN